MKNLFYSSVLVLVVISSNNVVQAQYLGATDIDFGIGYREVILFPSSDSLVFYLEPSVHSLPVAVLTGFHLTFPNKRDTVDVQERLIHVVYNDIYGLPILELSPDSAWARIPLNPKTKAETQSAWVSLAGIENRLTGWQLWTQFFKPDYPVIFLRDSLMGFYPTPRDTAMFLPKLNRPFGRSDYCMRVIQRNGHWMQVYLEIPSTFMHDTASRHARYKSKNPPPKYWIKYLDDRGRPRIWYLWD